MQVCTSLQTDNHASTPPLSFLQAGCPSCRPTNSVKALRHHSLQQSIDISCLPGPQQQRVAAGWDRQTPDSCIDPALHTVWVVPVELNTTC